MLWGVLLMSWPKQHAAHAMLPSDGEEPVRLVATLASKLSALWASRGMQITHLQCHRRGKGNAVVNVQPRTAVRPQQHPVGSTSPSALS